MAPPVSKVYQDQLTTPSHGIALWHPNPPKEIYDKVSIGDVGYLHEDSFIRMFNVMLPWSHESNRTLGEPEPYESLDCGPFANTLKRQFDRVKHCSRNVSAETNDAGSEQAMTSSDVESVTYKFRNCGALLSLPNGGYHEDVIRAQVFEDYIQDHVDSWFTWAQKNRLGVEHVEDLILVSGCTLVTSWAAAAFVDDTIDAEISLASRTLNNGGASFVWSNIRGCVLYHNSCLEPFHGEQNSTMTRDQCVFIRGFRVEDDKMQVIRVSCVPEYDDPNIGVVDTIRPPIKDENPQPSPDRHLALQSDDGPSYTTFLSDDSHTGGSSSSLVTIRHPTNHEYPSCTTLQSNGGRCNASFMTSPSYDSSIEDLSYFAEICHEDAFAESTTSITPDDDLLLVDNVESLTVDAEDSLRENDTSLLNWNSPTILRDSPETKQMTAERKQGEFRREIRSNSSRRMTRARFTSSLEIRDHKTKDVEAKRRALLVGITYTNPWNTWSQLDGPHGDVDQYRGLLINTYGYRSEDIVVLKDLPEFPEHFKPTQENMIRELKALVSGAEPGDKLTFFYSGHSDLQDAKSDLNEEDGMDESAPLFLPEDLKAILVNPLPVGCNLLAILDTCHSGTMLDLPHYHCNSVYVPWQSKGERLTMTMQNIDVRWQVMDCTHSEIVSPVARFFCDGWCGHSVEPHPNVLSLSACSDLQHAWEGPKGSLTTVLCNYLKKCSRPSYGALMAHINFELHDNALALHEYTRHERKKASGFDGELNNFQEPELSSLVRLNMDDILQL